MNPGIRDTVILLNGRFVPEGPGAAYPYGAVQHALQAASVLTARGARVGFVLYERSEDATSPTVRRRTVLGRYPAATFSFHFRMGGAVLSEGLRRAVRLVGGEWPAQPLLYLQTSVLLPFVPEEYAVLVTHHGPFVADVRRVLGAAGARQAFDWDHPKADALELLQADAIEVLRRRADIGCAEISLLQETFLRRVGVSKLRRLPPPVAGARTPTQVDTRLRAAVLEAPTRGLIAVTAVARLDHFKNVELFVRGCVEALTRGDLARAILIGGLPEDPERHRLAGLVPAPLRGAFTFLPRQPHDVVTGWLFPALARRGVFACTSRFDLVPYTALEAARTGLTTLAPDTGAVGASEYLPDEYLFRFDATGLADTLGGLAEGPSPCVGFAPTARRIAATTSDDAFAAAFAAACHGA